MKKILNIVFYQFFGSNNSEKQACIFYDDGTFANVSFNEGIDACELIVKERNIQTKDAFREMINSDMVHVVSGEQFERSFRNYFPKSENLEKTTRVVEEPVINKDKDEDEEEIVEESINENKNEEKDNKDIPAEEAATAAASVAGATMGSSNNKESNDKEANKANDDNDEIEEEIAEEIAKEEKKENKENKVVADRDTNEEVSTEEKPGFFKRTWEKLKNSKLAKRIVLCVTALAVGLGIYSIAKKQSKEGQMANSNLTNVTQNNNIDYTDPTKAPQITPSGNDINNNNNNINNNNNNVVNRDYEAAGTRFRELLARTNNLFQRNAMMNVDEALKRFNGIFADAFVEQGKDIRAALTFDEVVALQNAYNEYSKEELRAYFNGADINANRLTRAYKDATLQLMAAHIIETDENQVDMSMLIDSKEGKEFYQKYHAAFLAAKNATGEDKVAKVKAFYDMVREDFYLSFNLRTEGISHAEIHNIEPYKLSVTPMIAASEMLFQNLRKDVTLNDQEVEFFNEIGLCSIASAHYRRIETISLGSEADRTNPLYEEYRQALIEKYTKLGIYYIDDKHRELTRLDRFRQVLQDQNPMHRTFGAPIQDQPAQPTTTTTTEEVVTTTEPVEETTVVTETTVTEVPAEEVPEEVRTELEQQVDQQIEQDNEEARIAAEAEAERIREEMQRQADEEAARIEQEVAQDDQQLQEAIEDANEQIGLNQDADPTNDDPVNEEDFGDADVDFDDEHSDEDGNLDDSVQDLTTDPTGDQTGEELPDPQALGEQFDRQADTNPTPAPQPSEQPGENPPTSVGDEGTITSEEVPDGTEIDEFWEEIPAPNSGSANNEEVVDRYIAMLENTREEQGKGRQYTL